jgi:glycosyltransferase involved in cell wall biosynthesis
MKIDIAICTWNRAKLLGETLRSFANVNIPPGVFVRTLVVNNNSTDDTVQVVNDLIAEFNRRENSKQFSIALFTEPQQGHTFSRNRAIAMADSDLMLWTDDDVIVGPNWLGAYLVAAENREFAFWGGKVFPRFDPDKPDWIAENWENLKGCFAARDLGDQPLALTADRLPYGANFAIRTSVQKQFPFNTELGRRKNILLGEDELDLFRRLLAAGYRGAWVPESRLEHVISAERASENYVREYFIGQGRALVARGEPWSRSRRKLFWQAVYEFAAYRFTRHWAKSPAWVAHLIRSGLAEGQYLAI